MLKRRLAVLGVLWLGFMGVSYPKDGNIRHADFEDFSEGTLGNAGANLYVSKKGTVQVINQWDLNRDGYVDLVLSNTHDNMSVVDALVYWGSPEGPRSLLPELWRERPLAQVVYGLMDGSDQVTRLPSFGGGRSAVADLNRDGFPDLVFCNYIHNYPGVRTAYVYWGSRDGYSRVGRTELPTRWAAGVVARDLNSDGYPDLVFANQGVEAGAEKISPKVNLSSYIYWGSANGFDPDQPGLVPTRGARDVAAGDVNGDGDSDLIFVNNSPQAKGVQVFLGRKGVYTADRSWATETAAPGSVGSGDLDRDGYDDVVVTTSGEGGQDGSLLLFFGGKDGPVPSRSQTLPAIAPTGSEIADLDGNGYLDLAVSNSSNEEPLPESYVYWGGPEGFSVQRRSQLPTLAPADVASGDLNQDGHPDLVFANSHDGTTVDVPSYVYWGSPTGFAPYMRTDLQGFGGNSVNVADLNQDGHLEVVLVNRWSGTHPGKVLNNIYWGNPHHYYSTASRTALPGLGAYAVAVADLDDDGFNDLVLTNSYAEYSWVYWGSPEGYSPGNRQELAVANAHGVSAADLNRDGFLELVFTHGRGQKLGTIYWGGEEGYADARRTSLPLKNQRCSNNRVADLNHDGHLDLLFPGSWYGIHQIFWGDRDGYSPERSWSRVLPAGNVELADLNSDGNLDFMLVGSFDPETRKYTGNSYLLWGTPEGVPTLEGKVELEGHSPIECGIADLNRDGHLDLVMSNYMSGRTRTLPVFIYWGGEGGTYSRTNRTDLPAYSSSAIQTVDLNRDGYPEIVVHNHMKDGDHSINTYIYWNGPEGFHRDRKTEIPSFGPHYSQMTDPGDLYTRRLEEKYVSPPLELPGSGGVRLVWEGEEPHGARLQFQIRTASSRDGLESADWMGPSGAGSFYQESGAEIAGLDGTRRWAQYRAVFTSPAGGVWPILSAVELQAR